MTRSIVQDLDTHCPLPLRAGAAVLQGPCAGAGVGAHARGPAQDLEQLLDRPRAGEPPRSFDERPLGKPHVKCEAACRCTCPPVTRDTLPGAPRRRPGPASSSR